MPEGGMIRDAGGEAGDAGTIGIEARGDEELADGQEPAEFGQLGGLEKEGFGVGFIGQPGADPAGQLEAGFRGEVDSGHGGGVAWFGTGTVGQPDTTELDFEDLDQCLGHDAFQALGFPRLHSPGPELVDAGETVQFGARFGPPDRRVRMAPGGRRRCPGAGVVGFGTRRGHGVGLGLVRRHRRTGTRHGP